MSSQGHAAAAAATAFPKAMAGGSGAAVSCRNVTVRFVTDRRTVTALENVSFEVEHGGFLSLLGPSGCGKSTLLRVVADLIAPSGGSARVLRHVAAGGPRRRARSASCSRMRRCCPGAPRSRMSSCRSRSAAGAQLPPKAPTPRELLKLVGLEGWENSFPHELSGGMRQRVSIARALLGGPRLLLMDEPFGALDEITRDRLNEELRRIWQETGTTILFVTHSVYEAMFLGEQVLVLAANPGRVRELVPIDLPRDRDAGDPRDRARSSASPRGCATCWGPGA